MATANPRRTQEQRRTEMRARLMEATIESLMEDGYAATTLRAVASRADVSSGAMTHHFPRRVELVTAAVENLVEQREAVLRPMIDQLPGAHEERVHAILDILWSDFSGPIFTVFVKLWVAAHDDPELYERMIPLERKLARIIAKASADLAADNDFRRHDLDARVLTVLCAARGLALQRAFEPRRQRGGDPWPRMRSILERVLLEP
jgi:AcrR family transcriptional regulator